MCVKSFASFTTEGFQRRQENNSWSHFNTGLAMHLAMRNHAAVGFYCEQPTFWLWFPEDIQYFSIGWVLTQSSDHISTLS